MSESDQPKKPGLQSVLLLGLLATPLLYVLGLGPAVFVHRRASPPVKAVIVTIYTPLEMAMEFAPEWGENLLHAYAELFDR